MPHYLMPRYLMPRYLMPRYLMPHYLVSHYLMSHYLMPRYLMSHYLMPHSLPHYTSHRNRQIVGAMDMSAPSHHHLSTYECFGNGISLEYAYDLRTPLDHSHFALGPKNGCFWPVQETHLTYNRIFWNVPSYQHIHT